MIKKEGVFNYYLSEDFKPDLPEDVGFRHFRMKCSDGVFRKVPEPIRSVDSFKKWIIKYGGLDIYFGTSSWLNPHKVAGIGTSGNYYYADNIIIDHLLVFDIDAGFTIKRLDLARKSANNIYQGMKAFPRFEPLWIVFSGMKGFQLVYKDHNLQLPAHPHQRFDYIKDNRRFFIDKLLSHIETESEKPEYYKIKTFFDEDVTNDPMRIIRVPGCVHSKTGFISAKISPSLFRKPITELINHIPHILGKGRPGIPKREMTSGASITPRPHSLPSARFVSGLATLPPHKYFVTNRVLGVKKCYIPVFIYQKGQKVEQEILHLQRKYALGDLYVFEYEKGIVVLSLKITQRRRLQKILNESTSKTKYSFLKYRRCYIPTDVDFKQKIEGNHTAHVSRGHYRFYNKSGTRQKLSGWEQIEMVQATRLKDGK